MHKRTISIHCSLVYAAFIIGVLSISAFIRCSKDPTSAEKENNQLEYVSPEEVGYSSEKLDEARQFAEQSGYVAYSAEFDQSFCFSLTTCSEFTDHLSERSDDLEFVK